MRTPYDTDAIQHPYIHNMNITNKHGSQSVCAPDVKCLFVHVRDPQYIRRRILRGNVNFREGIACLLRRATRARGVSGRVVGCLSPSAERSKGRTAEMSILGFISASTEKPLEKTAWTS
jgi:hypothetical protein